MGRRPSEGGATRAARDRRRGGGIGKARHGRIGAAAGGFDRVTGDYFRVPDGRGEVAWIMTRRPTASQPAGVRPETGRGTVAARNYRGALGRGARRQGQARDFRRVGGERRAAGVGDLR